MYITYNNLPNNARVWVYQSERMFTRDEIDFISENAQTFVEQWTRHGDDLKGSFTIKYDQFLVLAVDESFADVSGCSIDASVRFVQALEQKLNVDLMDKMNISFKDQDNINIVKMSAFKEYAKANKITAETIVFNNMIATKEDLETKWEVPANQSWHRRFLA
ncbi:ABC transporter ATPase [Flavobacteriaceae bacterium S356]|uniref:ABC transporter ATPase n=1 Tax=Asprobacillus argus TaxID=3076534 RepID=A0ABU3LIF3_9FLAO|nr:ABC transporter ATPase [Flavobacteriaceae bacterium S356]